MEGMDNKAFETNNDIGKVKAKKKLSKDPEEEDSIDNCGFPCLPLRFINFCRKPGWFLFFVSWAACIQGLAINGLINVVITTLERRFNLQSTQTGVMSSSYDIGSLLVMIPVSYLGGRPGANKPKWIGIGMIILGIGSLVYAIPHFSTSQYSRSSSVSHRSICDKGSFLSHDKNDVCSSSSDSSDLSLYRLVFVLGQLLHGAGAAPLITIGTTFLHEIVSTRSSPMYIGIFQAWFVIGPAFGFVIGGQLLTKHVDLDPDSGLSPLSSLWVGAWWPGFLLSFGMAIICGFCLMSFPNRIGKKRHATAKPKEEKAIMSGPSVIQEMTLSESHAKESKRHKLLELFKGSKELTEFWKFTKSLAHNPTYILITLGQAMDGFAISGLSAFLPKFIENQYLQSKSFSAMIVGILAVPAGGGGTCLGGFIIKWLNLTRTRIIVMCFVSQIMAAATLLTFIGSCDSLNYVGINYVPFSGEQTSKILLRNYTYFPELTTSDTPFIDRTFKFTCNEGCGCSKQDLDPVCGSDNMMYLSPCHAGCQTEVSRGNYTDCQCVSGDTPSETGSASNNKCTNECNMMVIFCVIMFFTIILTFLAAMPGVVATLRAVPPEQNTLALGIQSIVGRLIGTIPGPILFGLAMDKACLFVEPSCDPNANQSCLVYDNHKMSSYLLIISMTIKLLSCVFYGLAILTSKRRAKHHGEEEGVVQGNNDLVIAVTPVDILAASSEANGGPGGEFNSGFEESQQPNGVSDEKTSHL